MIKNEKQYQVTQKKLSEFEDALQQIADSEMSAEEKEIRAGFVRGHLEVFAGELHEYEKLKTRQKPILYIDMLNQLTNILIKARISNGWTQAELAGRLGLKEQQIQRYESTDYETAAFARIVEIFHVLKLRITARFELSEPVFKIPANAKKISEKIQDKRALFSLEKEEESCIL